MTSVTLPMPSTTAFIVLVPLWIVAALPWLRGAYCERAFVSVGVFVGSILISFLIALIAGLPIRG